MVLLEDLNKEQSVGYWYKTHFTAKSSENKQTVFIVGTGFDSTEFIVNYSLVQKIQAQNILVKQMPSPEAIKQYNNMRDSLNSVSILLKIK